MSVDVDEVAPSFDHASATIAVQGDRGTVSIDRNWGYHGHPNGGYLFATLLRATSAVAGRADLVTAACQFVQSPEPGEAHVVVQTVRAGRRVAYLRSRLVQSGAVVLDALVTCADRSAAAARAGGPIDLPPIDGCITVAPRAEVAGIAHRVGVHYHPDFVPRSPLPTDGPPHFRAWVTLADGGLVDRYAAVLAADVLPPTIRNFAVKGWTPTIHNVVHFRAEPAPGPLAVFQTSRQPESDLFDEDIEVYDGNGVLVLQARQVSLVFG
jgi:hypothetical protein